MNSRSIVLSMMLIMIAVSVGFLSAGDVKQVRTFETWNAGIINSTDPAGITYHPPSGHLFISDSEINEIPPPIWNCENVFEVNLTGDTVFSTYDAYDKFGDPCPPTTNFQHREPTGITYNEFDGYFYISDDGDQALYRHDDNFGEPLARGFKMAYYDFEDITSDPSTGFLYTIRGEGQDQVDVYDPSYGDEFLFLYGFSVAGIATDPEGIAYNSQLNHLFVLSGKDKRIYEFTLDGTLVTDYDISNLVPAPDDAQGLTFAPSSDRNDDPDNFNLYIVDGQIDNHPDGIVYEVEILPFDFIVAKKFKMDKHGDSNGNVHSNDKIEFRKGLPSTFTGNLTAVTDIKIDKKNTVNGNVTAGGNLEIKSGATVNGTALGNAAVSTMKLPSVSFGAGGSDVNLNDDQILDLAPGSYGKVEAGKRSTLKLSSGEYFFKKLELKDDATLLVDGEVMVNVVEQVKFNKRARVDIAGSRHLTLKQVKDKDMKFDEDSRFWGSVIAPLAKIKLDKNAEFKGSIVAKEIEVKENATLNTHSATLVLAGMSAPQAPEGQAGTQTGGQEESHAVPSVFSLSQNYPNPFNPETQIDFQLPTATHVNMRIYNVRGQEVLRFLDRTYGAGTHTVRWDGKDNHGNLVPSGIYFYRFQAGEFVQVKKMNLLK